MEPVIVNCSQDNQQEIFLECLRQALPAARAYGQGLKSRIKNLKDVSDTFCTLVKLNSRTDQQLMRNEMLLEGTECIKWLINKLSTFGTLITVKTVCDSITLLEGRYMEEWPGYELKYVQKYPRPKFPLAV